MAQFFQIHPANPQPRLIQRAVELLRDGAVIVYPTDSCYALGCAIGDKASQDRIRAIRRLDEKHNFTLMCRDLSEITTYAKLDNQAFRLVKLLTPGAYTFIFQATKQVPRRLQNPRRKSIGIRVPEHPVAQALLAELNEALMSTTLILPGEAMPQTDPYEVRDLLGHAVDLIMDGGFCGLEPSTVVDMTGDTPLVARVGKGDTSLFEE
jgi:tRNA threonylcarbamoyl adenosine modification protein (Sua5/YciO/YrdC/YwlC family)